MKYQGLWWLLCAGLGCSGEVEFAEDGSTTQQGLRETGNSVERDVASFPSGQRTDWRSALLQSDTRLNERIRQAGPAAGLLAFASNDVLYLAPTVALAAGRTATAKTLETVFPMNSNVRHDFQAFGGQVSQDGLLGFTFGSGTQRKMQDGTETTTPILYVAAWRLIQWEWRIEAYMWNTARVPAGPVPPAFPLLSADWKAQARSAGRRENSTEVALADTTFANLSANSGYTAAFSRYIAPEAVQATGRIYWGRAEVLPLFEGWGPLESILWTPFQSRSTWSGDVGFSVGNASYTLRRNDGTIEFQSLSKYLTIWARQANGEWLYVIDGGNSRPATPLSTP